MFEIWLSIFILLVIIELSTINLVSIWFAIGALVAAFTTIFTSNFTVQFAAFAITSLITLLMTKTFVKKFAKQEHIKTNIDRIIGEIGIVTKTITKVEPGEVKVSGKYWTAVSDKEIEEDKKVEVISINSVKLKVKEVKEEI